GPLDLEGSNWFHALELRFVIEEDALQPPPEILKGKRSFGIEVPLGTMLVLNVLISPHFVKPVDLPRQFCSAQPVWRARLRDGRTVILVARILEIDDLSRERLKKMREIHANVTGPPGEDAYLEVWSAHWSATGGNVIIVTALP